MIFIKGFLIFMSFACACVSLVYFAHQKHAEATFWMAFAAWLGTAI